MSHSSPEHNPLLSNAGPHQFTVHWACIHIWIFSSFPWCGVGGVVMMNFSQVPWIHCPSLLHIHHAWNMNRWSWKLTKEIFLILLTYSTAWKSYGFIRGQTPLPSFPKISLRCVHAISQQRFSHFYYRQWHHSWRSEVHIAHFKPRFTLTHPRRSPNLTRRRRWRKSAVPLTQPH